MKPKAVVVREVCSVCDLDWSLHAKADISECIRLLKIEANKPRSSIVINPQPIYPNTWPARPYITYSGTGTGGTSVGGGYTTTNCSNLIPQPVAA